MKKVKLITVTLFVTLLLGCNSKDANHLNIFSLPGAVVGSVIENVFYDRKRERVERYAKANYEVLKVEIERGDGKHLDEILTLSQVESSKLSLVKQRLMKDYSTIFHNVELTSQPIMQSFSRLYMPKSAKDKTMNGFTYTQAWKIISQRIDRDFDMLQEDIKSGNYRVLSKIANDLRIEDKVKRESFIHTLDRQYNAIFINHMVASVMVHGS